MVLSWFYRFIVVLLACVSAEQLEPNPILISEIQEESAPLTLYFANNAIAIYVSHIKFYRHKAKFYDSTRDTRTVSVALELSDSDSDVDILSDPEISERGSPI